MVDDLPSKDLHYLITRVINPILNSIIATLHSGPIVHYKDGTLDVTEYPIPKLMAKFLADWRDELWYRYSRKNLGDVSEDILHEYIETINYVYRRLHSVDEKTAKQVGRDLILLGQKIEEYLTGKVEVFSDFVFEVEKIRKGQPTKAVREPADRNHQGRVETADVREKKEINRSSGKKAKDFGVCPRCAAYDGDRSEKKLYQCPHCGEWFCEKHVKPALVLTFDRYQELWRKHPELRAFLEEEWHREDGHPCYPYTKKFWEGYENKRESLYGARRTSTRTEKRFIPQREPVRVPSSSGTWKPKERTRYEDVIINVKNRFKDRGSIYVTPREIRIETSRIKKVLPRSPSIRFEIRDGKRWVIIPESVYSMAYTPERKHEGRKHGKYALIGIALLILLLAGYLYSRGSFDNLGVPFLGNSSGSSQGASTHTPEYSGTQTIDKTNTAPIYSTSTPTHTSEQAPLITPESPCSNSYWRYIFQDALKCALTEEELSKISNLASQLKGESLQESAWNTLEWLHENIEYNYSKASLPAPVIWTSNGRISRVDAAPGVEIQTPYETIRRGAGVCRDYAILTAALLLEMNYSPVYVFSIEFENSPIGHAAVAIKINGEYFILDQHPPVMDLGTYYTDLAVYRQETLGERLFISNATVYEISRDKNGAIVREIGILSAEDFKQKDHVFSPTDLIRISTDLRKILEDRYPHLISDKNIANLEEKSYLPPGYSDGRIWRLNFPHYADYYNPVFHEQFVEYMLMALTNDENVKSDLKKFNRFWIKVEHEGDSLKVTLNLAKK